MKTPIRLQALVEDGHIDEVVRQLMSGKEATVYVVRCDGEARCAKVYKDAEKRNFRQASLYQEGRKTKNSRESRAIAKRSRFGRQAQEEAWQSVEVDTLRRLAVAGVRVPRVYGFHDGVVLMELLTDADGNAAPRLNDVELSEAEALSFHSFMIGQIVRMLCAGVIHGDLSEYNVLVDRDGPVIIDLPQAVDAAGNNNARPMLLRDVENMRNFFGRFAPSLNVTRYGDELWSLFVAGTLSPELQLTGAFIDDDSLVDVDDVIREITDVRLEHEAREDAKTQPT